MEPSLSLSESGIQLYLTQSNWTLRLTNIKVVIIILQYYGG